MTGRLGVGGKERQLIELIHGLSRYDYSLHLLVKNHDTFYFDRIIDDLASFHSFNRKHFRLRDFINLANLIKHIKPDVISTWASTASYLCLGARLLTSLNYKLVNCSIRNAPIELTLTRKFDRFMYPFFKIVVANSFAGLGSYKQNKRRGRYVLYNGFDTNRVPKISQKSARNKLNLQPNAFIVVMVGSLNIKKDHETFLYSVRECAKYQQQIAFLIVGDGPKRSRLENIAKQMNTISNIFFLGQRDDVELIFKAADVSVLTSTAKYGEGISNAIIESLGCGTPVIATDNPGTREIIDDGKNGIIIEPGDFKELANKILLLKNHPEIIERLSGEGFNKIQSKFSMEHMLASFINIIESPA